jgi:hypothetical protein
MSEEVQQSPDSPEAEKEQQASMKAEATIAFTLHVHLDDGTTKDIQCVGQIVPEPQE